MNGLRIPYKRLGEVFRYEDEALLVRHKCNPINGPCPMTGLHFQFTDMFDFNERLDEVLMLVVRRKSR